MNLLQVAIRRRNTDTLFSVVEFNTVEDDPQKALNSLLTFLKGRYGGEYDHNWIRLSMFNKSDGAVNSSTPDHGMEKWP